MKIIFKKNIKYSPSSPFHFHFASTETNISWWRWERCCRTKDLPDGNISRKNSISFASIFGWEDALITQLCHAKPLPVNDIYFVIFYILYQLKFSARKTIIEPNLAIIFLEACIFMKVYTNKYFTPTLVYIYTRF